MRRFLDILGACAIGLVAAFLFPLLAGFIWPCGGERLACSMTAIIRYIYAPIFAGIALIAFSVAMFWKGTPRALAVAMLVPLIPFLIFFAYIKWDEISVRELHEIRSKDIQELLQIGIPIALTLILPWVLLQRRYGEPKPN